MGAGAGQTLEGLVQNRNNPLLFFERLDDLRAGIRAVAVSRFQRWGYLRLVAERTAIREEIMTLAADFEA